ERACMRSVLRHGHPLSLFCYEAPGDVPQGVELRDAAEILPATLVVRHRSGSVALFANRFRYELQRRGEGLWVDADTYLVRPLDLDRPYLFGWEDERSIANGVLLTPPDSPLLGPLLAVFEEREVPPWLEPRARLAARWRLWRTGRTGIEQMPWGSAGPRALTHVARKLGLDRWALPPSVLYPVHWRDAQWIRDPARTLDEVVRADTIAVHLWNHCIGAFKTLPAADGSFLARLQAEGRS
ncbi:MAG TPA: hypothetical protein VGX37_04315, partial [Allosphingosinicella sp.]|nr:hypothetical protein [Allosphingosinicella sp.]